MRAEPRREDGHRDDQRRAAPGDSRVAAHHLAVGQDVGAAEFDVVRRIVALDQIGERAHDVARLRSAGCACRSSAGRPSEGSRSTSLRIITNDAPPAPITIAARACTSSRPVLAQDVGDLLAAAQVLRRPPAGRRGRRRAVRRRWRRHARTRSAPRRSASANASAPVPIECTRYSATSIPSSASSSPVPLHDVARGDLDAVGEGGARRVAGERAHARGRARAAWEELGRRRSRWRR